MIKCSRLASHSLHDVLAPEPMEAANRKRQQGRLLTAMAPRKRTARMCADTRVLLQLHNSTSGSQHFSRAPSRLDNSTACCPGVEVPSAWVLAGSRPPSQDLCWCRMLRMSCRAVLRTEREWSASALRGILIDSSVVRLPRSSEITALTDPA